MAYVLTDESNYEDIADAIREMNGTSDTYTPSQMAVAIRAIRAGVTGVKGNAEAAYRSGDVNLTPANIGAVALDDAVTGVKGNAESTYRKGNVNLTPANLGAATAEDVTKINNAFRTQIKYYLDLPYPIKAGTHAFEQNTSSSQIMWALQDIPDAASNTPDKWGRYHVDAYAYVKNAQMSIEALQAALAAAEAQRLAMYPTDTDEGESVAISDGADNVPLKALTVRITSQSGVTGVTITRRGKNIAEIENGTYAYAGGLTITVRDGVATIEGAYASTGAINRVIGTAQLRAGVTYTISGTKSSGVTDANVLRIDLRNPGGSVIASGDSYNGFTYTPSEDVTAQVNIRIESQQNFNVAIYPQVEAGSVATDFVPNTPTTYEIDWTETAGSAHDVTLDVLTGALTADGDAYTVTPVDVRTLLGANTFSSDAGTLSVTWRADIAAYVARKIAEALNA